MFILNCNCLHTVIVIILLNAVTQHFFCMETNNETPKGMNDSSKPKNEGTSLRRNNGALPKTGRFARNIFERYVRLTEVADKNLANKYCILQMKIYRRYFRNK